LTVTGDSLSNGVATLCVNADSVILHYDQWDTWSWWHAPGFQVGVRGDSVVRAVAARFLAPTAFGRLDPLETSDDWVDNPSFDRRAAVAAALKEVAYWNAHRVPVGVSIPAAIRDSLRRAPVDSALVRAIVDGLARDRATTFGYWLGDENGVVVAWWREGHRFLTVERP
jgi:hypothetical protein